MRIDLHTHSLRSDGSDTPGELIARAAEAGLDVVALTDHDTVEGWEEAAAAAAHLGITFVPGIEFSTTNDDHGEPLLGYCLDPAYPAVAEILRRASTSRADRIAKLLDRLDELGLPVDREFVASLAGGILSRKHPRPIRPLNRQPLLCCQTCTRHAPQPPTSLVATAA